MIYNLNCKSIKNRLNNLKNIDYYANNNKSMWNPYSINLRQQKAQTNSCKVKLNNMNKKTP